MSKVIIDVRQPEEFATDHAVGAINIPLDLITSGGGKLDSLPKDAEIIVYCNSGNRSGLAKKVLDHQGFKNVTNGINIAYVAQNYSA